MSGHRQRLGASGHAKIHRLRNRYTLALSGNKVFCESTVYVRNAGRTAVKENIPAKVGTAGETLRTAETSASRVDRYTLAEFERFDSRTNFDHLTSDFVTQNERFLQPEITNSPLVVVMKIRASRDYLPAPNRITRLFVSGFGIGLSSISSDFGP